MANSPVIEIRFGLGRERMTAQKWIGLAAATLWAAGFGAAYAHHFIF